MLKLMKVYVKMGSGYLAEESYLEGAESVGVIKGTVPAVFKTDEVMLLKWVRKLQRRLWAQQFYQIMSIIPPTYFMVFTT